MTSASLPSVPRPNPLYGILLPFPIVCFILTLATDLAYWQTGNLLWKTFSEWLLLVAMVFGGLAAAVGTLEILLRGSVRRLGSAWLQALGFAVVLVLGLWNNLIHARDGWNGVVPTGLVLSAATVVVLFLTVSIGRAALSRAPIGMHAHA